MPHPSSSLPLQLPYSKYLKKKKKKLLILNEHFHKYLIREKNLYSHIYISLQVIS
jgi:hypothetical protein